MTKPVFKKCIEFDLEIGESPVWDDERQILWFVDILRPAVYSFDPATMAVREYPMPADVGSIGLAFEGRLIVAMRTGVFFFDPGTGRLDFLVHPEPERTMNRLNDGKVGPDGSFWVGSMHDAQPREPTGGLYRIGANGAVTKVLDGLRVSNGLAWSLDGRTLYHSDSRGPVVRAFDFDPLTGSIANERTFIELDEEQGLPDGAAVDSNGCYWSAGVTSGLLNRFSSSGELIDAIELPVAAPTMPCFGGPDLKTLFVTSLTTIRHGVNVRGTLIAFEVDVPGVPVGRLAPAAAHAGV